MKFINHNKHYLINYGKVDNNVMLKLKLGNILETICLNIMIKFNL